jgi:hypothetical protein
MDQTDVACDPDSIVFTAVDFQANSNIAHPNSHQYEPFGFVWLRQEYIGI